jgi:putative transposase
LPCSIWRDHEFKILRYPPFHGCSIRLPGYDYSTPGGYYITVVSFRRECLFGEIINDEMKLSPIGEIVRREWFKTAVLRPNHP